MSEHVDNVVRESLRRSQEAAAKIVEGWGGNDSETVSNVSKVRREVRSVQVGTTARRSVVRGSVAPECLGVSVTLKRTGVMVSYPSDARRFVLVPMAWLTNRDAKTDRIISLDIDVDYLVGIVNG